jgi:SAM-dependent methyltransferase/uncharacterized protein YbaR (Trm112 family)
MRRSHLDFFAPNCPVCKHLFDRNSPLQLVHIFQSDRDHVIEGSLHCSDIRCQSEFPIIDGIPILVPNLREFIAGSESVILSRQDLSESTVSLIGDCCGNNSSTGAARQHLSSYAFDHYQDFKAEDSKAPVTSSIVDLLEKGLQDLAPLPAGPILDVGCSVGRTSFELAQRFRTPVLGIDLNFSMLRCAHQILRERKIDYDLRRVGGVYDRISHPVQFENSDLVDFWICDAMALPFGEGISPFVNCLNVLDCVSSPVNLLISIARVMQFGGSILLSSPYDWSPSATPVEAWIGGHSQRSVNQGRSEAHLEQVLSTIGNLLNCKLTVQQQTNSNWRVRLHERCSVEYNCHLLSIQKQAAQGMEANDQMNVQL